VVIAQCNVRFCNSAPERMTQNVSLADTCFWNNEILTPIQKNGMEGPGKLAFKKLRILLDRMMLRRTKVWHLLWNGDSYLIPLFSRFNAQTISDCRHVRSLSEETTLALKRKSSTYLSSLTPKGSFRLTLNKGLCSTVSSIHFIAVVVLTVVQIRLFQHFQLVSLIYV
jgi:hypothetical protein